MTKNIDTTEGSQQEFEPGISTTDHDKNLEL
jgi:hypothetical protein